MFGWLFGRKNQKSVPDPVKVEPKTVRICSFPLSALAHYLIAIIGMPGSGKSILIRKLIKDIMRLRGHSTLILDTGDNYYYYLTKNNPLGQPIALFDPCLEGSCTFDFPALLSTPEAQWGFARRLCPTSKSTSQPFFEDAAATIIYCAVRVLQHFDGKFTLLDILKLSRNLKLLMGLLDSIPTMENVIHQLGDEKSISNVMGTVITRTQPHMIVAAQMAHAKHVIDPREFPGALVLRYRDRSAAALEGILAFVIDTVSDHRLSQTNESTHWFILDEFRTLQKLECISSIIRRGRKHRTNILLALHEIAGVRERYGADATEEMIGMLSYKCMLRVGSPETAKLAAAYLGETESLEYLRAPEANRNRDTSVRMTNRLNAFYDDIRRLPPPDIHSNRMGGFVDFPQGFGSFSCPWVDDVLLNDIEPTEKLLTAKLAFDAPFEPEDYFRLGIALDLIDLILKEKEEPKDAPADGGGKGRGRGR